MARHDPHPLTRSPEASPTADARLAADDIPLPDFIDKGPQGLSVRPDRMDDAAQLRRFVERVFGAGACFVGLDYEALSRLLYASPEAATRKGPAAPVRIAERIADVAPERWELYKSAKSIDDGARIEYLFEPVRLERSVEVPIFGATDEAGQPVVTGHEMQTRHEPATLDVDEFVAAMWVKGIRGGLDITAVRAAIAGGRTERVDIARRVDPEPGADATVQEQTEALHRDDSPSILPSGKMDLRHFKNHFPQVTAGTRLLQKQPRRLGVPGLDTDGSVLEPELPRDFELEDMAGPGTRVERTAKGEFLVAARDGFLNIDNKSHQISVTEKIINREGVSQRTTGNLQLVGEQYEEHGEVQEHRSVEGRHMKFHADVFGSIVSHGGEVRILANLMGGTVRDAGGLVQVDGRASRAVIEARDGEFKANHAESVTVVAARVHIGRAVGCDIVAEEVEIDEAQGCAIAARRIHIKRVGARRDAETLVTVCVPDYAAIDRQRAVLQKAVGELKRKLAAKQSELDARLAAGELRNYLAAEQRIRSGGITLSPAQDAQWKQATLKLARPLAEVQALRQDIERIESALTEQAEPLAALDEQRERAGADIGCTIDQVAGEVAVQTAGAAPEAAVFAGTETARLKQALRDTRTVRERLFRGGAGSFSWVFKVPAKD